MKAKEFRKAINIGLGRAIVALKTDQKTFRFRDSIIYACTHVTSYDPQCEGRRTEYLWDAIQASDAPKIIEDRVISDFLVSNNPYAIYQMAGLVCKFASNGNNQAKTALYDNYSFNDDWNSFVYDDLIDLDGLEGYLYIAECEGKRILESPDYSANWGTLSIAEEQFGAEKVNEILGNLSSDNLYIKAYYRSIQNISLNSENIAQRELVSYEEIKKQIENNNIRYPLHSWGNRAAQEDIEKAAMDLLEETNTKRLIQYLSIFRRRTFPMKPNKIIELAYSKNTKLSNVAIHALKKVKNDLVRNLAIYHLTKVNIETDALLLLIDNFTIEDILLLEKVAYKKMNRHKLHCIRGDICKILINNPVKECTNIMLYFYENGYCSICRSEVIEVLMVCNAIPEWVLEECKYDSNLEIRELVEKYLEHSA